MSSTWYVRRSMVAVLLAAACAVPASADVAIGVLIPSSGKGASYGQQQQNSINMFMEKFSDLGGRAENSSSSSTIRAVRTPTRSICRAS